MTNDASHDHTCCGPAARDDRLSAPRELPDTVPMVEVTRGDMVESRHRGRATIVDAAGRVVAAWGDIDALVYARSAVKAVQAIPLVESGAADAFGLSDAEIALACASHSGQPMNTGRVAAWLDRIGCTAADLECGAHLPYHPGTAEAMLRRGEAPTAIRNNCSGKHAGMLTTACHKGEPLKGYVRLDHTVQQRIYGVLEQMTGHDLSDMPRGIDGCSIPVIGMPLGGLALAMAGIADPRGLPGRRAEAVLRIRRAWAAHPELIGGRDSFDTKMMQALRGAALLKGGAEGVACAVLPEHGLGIALKIEDGAARAAHVAMAALLDGCGLSLEDPAAAALCRPALVNRVGLRVGELRPAPALAPA